MRSAVSSVVSEELAVLVLSAGLLSLAKCVEVALFPFAALALGTFQCDLSSGSCQKAEKSAVWGVRPSLSLSGCQFSLAILLA